MTTVYVVVAEVYEGGPRSQRLVKGFHSEAFAMELQSRLNDCLKNFIDESKKIDMHSDLNKIYYARCQEDLSNIGDANACMLYDLSYEVEELEVD